MTNPELQKELKEKVKEGVKPSDLKKLKRSKSDSALNPDPPIQLLQEQLKEKQKQIEELRQQLENQPTPPKLLELDNSLQARHQNLKAWFTQYQKNKQLDAELQENIAEASQELINQDQIISQLRNQITSLQQTNQSLTKDLNLATKLAAARKTPLPNYYSNDLPDLTYLKLTLYSLLALILALWFLKRPNPK